MAHQIKPPPTIPGSDTAVRICGHCADTLRAHKLTPEERQQVEPGAYVKVNCCDEGFFVKVTSVKGETIQGIVNNDLMRCTHYRYGDTVELEMDEAYQVIPRGEE